MFCKHCGKPIAADSVFCKYCGGTQGTEPAPTLQHKQEQWETGEIKEKDLNAGLFSAPVYRFVLSVVGSQGAYEAGSSESFKTHWQSGEPKNWNPQIVDVNKYPAASREVYQRLTRAYDSLVRQLYNDGWESTGHGAYWYSARFRRRVN